jgi:tetratricopeptide (TPR) repeat protein
MMVRTEQGRAPIPSYLIPSPLLRRFRVLRFLGSGAEGRVFLAEDRSQHDCPVSLKVLDRPRRRDLPDLRLRLSAVARIDHPNVARILDFDVAGDRRCLWIAREYVPGEDLSRFVARRPRSLYGRLLESVARALVQFHDRGLVHGDLRPANILCSASPEGPMLKLIDGGVATAASLLHQRRQDLRFAGAAFYTALTGKEADRRTPPSRWNPSIPRWIDRLILRLLIPYAPDGVGSADLFLEEILRHSRTRVQGRRLNLTFSKPPIVGRELELGLIRERIDRAERPGVVLLTGDAGSGKSAVLREAQVYARARGIHFFASRSPAGEGLPHDPLVQIAQSIAATFGWKDPFASAPDRSRAELILALSRLLARAAQRRTCIVAIDDVESVGPDTREMIRSIVKTLHLRPFALPIVFVAALRSVEEGRRWSEALGRTPCTAIPLGPLKPESALGLIRITLGQPPDEAMVRRLHSLTGGNPGLLLTSLELLRHRFRHEGSSVGVPNLESLPVPRDAEAAAARLVAGLKPPEARAARALAVHPGFLKDAVCRDVLGEDVLWTLSTRGVLRRISLHTYEWASTAVRHDLLSKLSGERRRRLHEAFALAGRRLMRPGILSSNLFQAYHLARGSRPDRAYPHALDSAELLCRAFRYGEAADYYELALRLLPPGRPSETCAILRLLQAACRNGGLNRRGKRVSLELLRRQPSLTQAALCAHFIRIVDGPSAAALFIRESLRSRWRRSPGALALLYSKLGFAEAMRGRSDEASRVAATAETYLAECRDPAVRADAYLDFGSIRYLQGNLAGACEDYLRALDLTRRDREPVREALLCDNLSLALRGRLRMEEALRFARRALSIKLRSGLLLDSAVTRLVLGAILDDLGASESAKGEYLRAREIFRSRGDAFLQAVSAQVLGWAHLTLEEHPEALDWFDRSFQECPPGDRSGLLLFVHSGRALVYLATGLLPKAEECLRQARAVVRRGTTFESRLAWLRARSLAAAAGGRRREAALLLRQAARKLGRSQSQGYLFQFRLIELGLDAQVAPERALPRIDDLISELEPSGLRPLLCDARLLGAETNLRAGRPRRARALLARAGRLLETLPQPSLHVRHDLLRSSLEGSPSQRLQAALEAYKRATKHELRVLSQAAALQLARGYEAREDYSTALKYYEEARTYAGNKSA